MWYVEQRKRTRLSCHSSGSIAHKKSLFHVDTSLFYRLKYGLQSGGVLRFHDLRTALDEITAAALPLLLDLQEYRRNGRPGYPLAALFRAYVATFLLNLPHTNGLIRALQDDPDLRCLCGLWRRAPSPDHL